MKSHSRKRHQVEKIEPKKGLSDGAIAGISVSIILVLVGIGIGVYFGLLPTVGPGPSYEPIACPIENYFVPNPQAYSLRILPGQESRITCYNNGGKYDSYTTGYTVLYWFQVDSQYVDDNQVFYIPVFSRQSSSEYLTRAVLGFQKQNSASVTLKPKLSFSVNNTGTFFLASGTSLIDPAGWNFLAYTVTIGNSGSATMIVNIQGYINGMPMTTEPEYTVPLPADIDLEDGAAYDMVLYNPTNFPTQYVRSLYFYNKVLSNNEISLIYSYNGNFVQARAIDGFKDGYRLGYQDQQFPDSNTLLLSQDIPSCIEAIGKGTNMMTETGEVVPNTDVGTIPPIYIE